MVVLSGSLKFAYSGGGRGGPVPKETFGPGSRIIVLPEMRHAVLVGTGGCTYLLGEWAAADRKFDGFNSLLWSSF